MATHGDDFCLLREWAPLTDMFNKLPTRLQNGIFNKEVKLTCIDVLSNFIVLGTNLGVVYWYDRKKKDLQRLRCENLNSAVTVVKVISTVDYMLACGNKEGNISIFQIPKSHPDNLPECLKPKNKQVERYTVSDMHKGSISAIEWSKNGMKLFSGDKNGLVVLTEIDFYMHICKSVEILNEAYEVVQLGYHQQNLLISTMYRTIICQRQDKWKVTQVGKKDRKLLGKFGAIFYPNGICPNNIVLYCTRPGLRIWESNIAGCVQQTLLFKDILNRQCPEVSLINPISNDLRKFKPSREASFGILLTYQDLVVTYSSDVVYILNPKDLSIVSTVSNLRGILGVATNKEEIFILEEERSVIRLSHLPENFNEECYSIPSASTFIPLSTSIRELKNKIHTSTIISAIPPFGGFQQNSFSIYTDITSVINAEEAIESSIQPATKSIRMDSSKMKLADDAVDRNKRMEIFNKIAKEEFDDTILFKHCQCKKQTNMTSSICSLSCNSSDDINITASRPTLMNLSSVEVMAGLTNLRSPDTILSDIEQKEKMLANILNFDQVKINLEDLQECEKEISSESQSSRNGKGILDLVRNEVFENINFIELNDSIEDDIKINVSKLDKSAHPDKFNTTLQVETPVVNIPNDWKLSHVKLTTTREKSESDNSLGDWEII